MKFALSRCWLLLLCLFIAPQVVAKKFKPYSQATTSEADFHSEVRFDFANGLPIVTVDIAGQPYRFLFDTAAVSTISPQLAEQLKLEVKPLASVSAVDAGGQKQQITATVVPKMRVGDITILNAGMAVFDLRPANGLLSCLALDGIIGYNLIDLFAGIKLDYQRQILTLSSAAMSFPASATQLKMEVKPGMGAIARLHFSPEVKNVPVVLDTGKNLGFGLPVEVGIELNQKGLIKHRIYQLQTKERSALFSESKNQEFLTRFDKVKLDSLPLDPVVINFSPGLPLLGNEFLRQYHVYLNWQQQTFALEPVAMLHLANEWKSFGIYPTFDAEQGLVIGKVLQNLNKTSAKLQLGDRILKIAEFDATKEPLKTVCFLSQNRYAKHKIEQLLLTLERDQQVFQVQLQRQRLFADP
ncbi:retropepsin-like aspartic protease [Motilimonas pumila]|uniref:retropepsin-like aspartic protease n=1 Tax=Motilimonas pumila TaxID=2303987 RepID=UPI0013141B51|nr:retropepsin-like aspartic protease [Motilimonas pumila]